MNPTTSLDSVTLTERADAAFCAGQLDAALRDYVALLRADPGDGYLLYRTALLLARVGERELGIASLNQAAERLAESGQLMLALAAARDLLELAPEQGRARARAIGGLHGRGSARVDRKHRPPPPPMPERITGAALDVAAVSDRRVLRELAIDACTAASSVPSVKGPLPHHPLFSDLEPSDFEAVLPLVTLRAVGEGEPVIEQGTEGTSFYVVARGLVEVTLRRASGEQVSLATLRSGAFFGEMALLTHSPRAAGVSAGSPALLLELGRDGLDSLAERNPNVASVLARYTRERLLRNLIATCPLFVPLDPERRERLIDLFASHLYQPREKVIGEGEPSDGLFVVLNGAVRVSKREQGEALALAELGPGQIFGEISLIQRKPATATVVAVSKTVLLSLSRETFNEHVAEFPEVVAHVYRVAVEREKTNRNLESTELVPVDEELLLI
jgi:cAMP-dependent protein kinase regulator